MTFTSVQKKEIENIVRKEIKSFMNTATIKQFEEKFLDKIQKEVKRGRLDGDIKNITLKMFNDFYQLMWKNRNKIDSKIKN